MTLQQALTILAREKHNGHTRWDGTCPPSSAAWRTEFEVIAIAEAYERAREPDPCAALRVRLERAHAGLRKLEGSHTIRTGDWIKRCSLCGLPASDGRHGNDCPFAALGAAGETITCDRCLMVATTNKDWQIMGDEHLCPDCVSQLAAALDAAGERSEGESK